MTSGDESSFDALWSWMDGLALPVALYDKSLRRSWVNRAFTRLANRSRDELLGHRPTELPMFDDQQARDYEQALSAVLRDGHTTEFELAGYLPNGHRRCNLLHLVPHVSHGSERPDSVWAISFDVSELRNAEHRLARVQELSKTGDWIWRRSVAHVDFSSSAQNIFRLESPRWSARALWQHYRQTGHGQAIRNTIRSRLPELHIEHELVFKSGRSLRLASRLAFAYDRTGRVIEVHGVTHDITQLTRLLQANERLSSLDPLTGLLNRSTFTASLSRWSRPAPGLRLWVMAIRLDDLLGINTAAGRVAGDLVLSAVADRLKNAYGDHALIGRLSGARFGLALHRPLDQAFDKDALSAELVRHLAGAVTIGGQALFPRFRVGLAPLDVEEFNAAELVEQAWLATAGSGRAPHSIVCEVYDQQLKTRLSSRYELKHAMAQCTARGELVLMYQPKVDLQTGALCGAEALMRWKHPTLGMIQPDVFIPLSESTGHILHMGRWALHEACAQINRLRHLTCLDLKIAVNVSVRQVQEGNLDQVVHDVLIETGCPPQALELEITESALLGGSEQTSQVFERLKALGVSLALDDFGTGYSSLSYLMRIPLDTLKVDRCFVSEIGRVERGTEVGQAIVSLGRGLRMTLVAEGVETVEQAQTMARMGCHLGQGWLFGRPLSHEAFEALCVAEADKRVCADASIQ